MINFWILFILMVLQHYYAFYSSGEQAVERLTFIANENNSPKCGNIFMQGLDYFTINGNLNSSSIQPKHLLFEIRTTHGTIHSICSITFSNATPFNNSNECFCQQHEIYKNMYYFTYKLSLEKSHSSSIFATILHYGHQSRKDTTKEERIISLPPVFQIGPQDHSFELSINDVHIVNITNCSRTVNSSRLKIGYTSLDGITFVPKMRISYKNITILLLNNAYQTIDLNLSKSQEAKVTLHSFNCVYFDKEFNCSIVLDTLDFPENNEHINVYAIIGSVVASAVVVEFVVFILIYMCIYKPGPAGCAKGHSCKKEDNRKNDIPLNEKEDAKTNVSLFDHYHIQFRETESFTPDLNYKEEEESFSFSPNYFDIEYEESYSLSSSYSNIEEDESYSFSSNHFHIEDDRSNSF